MWTAGLAEWFATGGRHHLPWRLTDEPWAVLVSEVMLQQTSVARVRPRWERFLARWPTSSACAAAPLDEVLREWQGLGYPRRARALWLCARRVTSSGWPEDEAGLRELPGVGAYTARALLAFTSLGGDGATQVPRDVNLGRVPARAALGLEPHRVSAAVLDRTLRDGRPAAMPMRHYTYALFDAGALHCRARPLCAGCPLRAGCAWLASGAHPEPAPRSQGPYAGSLRQLRGAILALALETPGMPPARLAAAATAIPGATGERVRLALDGLVRDGLIGGEVARQT